jgi:prefoldin subunit 5
VSIEKTIAEAKTTVQTRISEMEKTMTSLRQQLIQVVNRMQENRDELEELTAKLSGAEKAPDVPQA